MTMFGKGVGVLAKGIGSATPSFVLQQEEVEIPEYFHPFKVYKPVFTTDESGESPVTSITFSLFVGHVFGKGPNGDEEGPGACWNANEENLSVKIGSSVGAIAGSQTYDLLYLDERNVGVRYTATLDGLHDNVLYVIIEGRSDGQYGCVADLELKSVMEAEERYEEAPPDSFYMEDEDFKHLDDTFHGGVFAPTNPLVVDDVQIGNQASTLTLTQKWNVYKNTQARGGVHIVPIAYIRMVDGAWTVRQVLRSDIFFPNGLNLKTFYIDTFTEDFSGGCGI